MEQREDLAKKEHVRDARAQGQLRWDSPLSSLWLIDAASHRLLAQAKRKAELIGFVYQIALKGRPSGVILVVVCSSLALILSQMR